MGGEDAFCAALHGMLSLSGSLFSSLDGLPCALGLAKQIIPDGLSIQANMECMRISSGKWRPVTL
jgi:hypothetical protein